MTDQETAKWLLARDQILILTHLRPDGDTIGCAAGLCHALRQQGKTAHILPNAETIALFTPYLEGLLAPEGFLPQTVVAVDMASLGLLPDNALPFATCIDLTIDHHPSQEFFARNTCLDGARAACGELIYDIIRQWGPVSAAAALPLYVAVATDTGCFVYGNTTADTHRVAAALMETGIQVYPVNKLLFRTKSYKRLRLEHMMAEGMEFFHGGVTAVVTLSQAMMQALSATEEDIDDISAFVGQIQGVQNGITLRQLSDGMWKLSLRTPAQGLNASKVCTLLGGGGHAAAAGATLTGDLEQSKKAVLQAISTIQNAGS